MTTGRGWLCGLLISSIGLCASGGCQNGPSKESAALAPAAASGFTTAGAPCGVDQPDPHDSTKKVPKKRCYPKSYFGRDGFAMALFSNGADVFESSDVTQIQAKLVKRPSLTHKFVDITHGMAVSHPGVTARLALMRPTAAMGPMGRATTEDATTQPETPIYVLLEGWCYVSGDGPAVGTGTVVAQSESSRLIVEVKFFNNRTVERHRVVLIESATQGSVAVGDDGPIPLKSRQYMDVIYDHTTDTITPLPAQDFVYPDVDQDTKAPKDLKDLIKDVGKERKQYEVP